MNKILLLFFLLLNFTQTSKAQSRGITPMHNFFQKYADSTIILEYNTDSYDPNYYFILTKTGDTINSFRYLPKRKFDQGLMPKALKILLPIEKNKNVDDPAAINSYFNVVNLNPDTLKTIWSRASTLNIWEIIEDNNVPVCTDPKRVAGSLHCGEIIVHRITKPTIQTLIFHCPWGYNDCLPGNYNRIGAIAVDKLFRVYFPDMYN